MRIHHLLFLILSLIPFAIAVDGILPDKFYGTWHAVKAKNKWNYLAYLGYNVIQRPIHFALGWDRTRYFERTSDPTRFDITYGTKASNESTFKNIKIGEPIIVKDEVSTSKILYTFQNDTLFEKEYYEDMRPSDGFPPRSWKINEDGEMIVKVWFQLPCEVNECLTMTWHRGKHLTLLEAVIGKLGWD